MIPTPDALPLPAPSFALKFLLLFGFLLHLIPMNVVLGGNLVVLATLVFGRGRPEGNLCRMGRDLSKVLPTFVSWAVTFGIVPLLFLQVLYGQAFYSSTILIGWYWFSIIPALIFAYYMAYLLREKWERLGAFGPLLSLIVCCAFIGIAYLWTTNISLIMAPAKWAGHYFANPKGTTLFRGESQLLPRYLHFVTGAIAVSGIATAMLGWIESRQDAEYGGYVVAAGSKIFVGATMVQAVTGIVFLLSLRPETRALFLGGSATATGLFAVGLTAAFGATGILLAATMNRKGSTLWTGAALAIVTLCCMVGMRQIARESYLRGLVEPDRFHVSTQWPMLILFGILLAWGIYMLIWLAGMYAAGAMKGTTIPGDSE